MKVARLWAGCLTWGLVTRGDWSYPDLTTRLLKQNTRIPQVEVGMRVQRFGVIYARSCSKARRPLVLMDNRQYLRGELPPRQILVSIHAREKEGGAEGERAEGACLGVSKEAKKIQQERRRSAEEWRGRATLHLNSSRTSDYVEGEEGEEEVLLWSSLARDLSANLAGVFKAEGFEEATRKAAAATIGRIEVMTRCYSILRVALQDIVEGKVGVL